MDETVAVVASRLRFEEKLLLDALEQRELPHVFVDPRTLQVALDGATPPWETALVREGLGVRTVNRAEAIETCGDKWKTALALRDAGLPVPRTLLALNPEA